MSINLSPQMNVAFGDPRLPERFWSKVAVDPATGCWQWTASLNGRGYGQFSLGVGRQVSSHRHAYLALVGPAPEQIDHLCRNRACCNPAHLEPVSNRENALRSPLVGAKTHCVNGHELTPENTRVCRRSGRAPSRGCKTCHREASVLYRRGRKEQAR